MELGGDEDSSLAGLVSGDCGCDCDCDCDCVGLDETRFEAAE